MRVNSSLEKAFEFCLPLIQRRTQNLTVIDQEKHISQTNLHFDPLDYQINYVNIDFVCHQCGFCVMKV